MVFILHSSIAAMFFYGTQLVLRAELSAGDLTAFILYGVIVAVSFGFLLNVFDEFMHAVGAGERIFQVLDSKPAITSPTPTSLTPGTTVSSQVEVEFRSVTFSYPSRSEVPVLKGVSLTIGEGQTTAIVGPSGAGKSTVSLLIPRFYDPSAGQVLFGGTDVRALNLRSLREQIAVVSQDSHLFSATLAENIRYGKRDATDDEVRKAAAAAQLAEFVASQPDGFNTVVGSRGVQLSGGQRQRVAIARAILRDPKFLILDEATSALDSENEHLIQAALTALMQGRTTLIIAHRLSTVQHAHQVLVMQEGQIVQRGTHQSLIEQPGLYRTLVEHQML
jgi:ATP-binding cassette subfamily B protein